MKNFSIANSCKILLMWNFTSMLLSKMKTVGVVFGLSTNDIQINDFDDCKIKSLIFKEWPTSSVAI